MNNQNIIIICKVVDNNLRSKFIINYNVYSKWTRLENLIEIVELSNCEIKYFDEEFELISIKDTEDFVTFLNIVLEKRFKNNEILVICYTSELSMALNNYENMKKLVESKSVEDNREKYQTHEGFSFEDPSSSSSSSFEINKSKKHRCIKRYAADVKKELNYLSGSEVSDGQTIVKKWQIKNVGMKKWKNNSVKCVLLPSEYSNWIQYEDIKVPVCFADQRVDVEIRIKIIGRWTEEQLSLENASQIIQLKWLLFMDKLIKGNDQNFMDFILTQLNLTLNVKSRNTESVSMDTVTNSLKKQTSESSIEKIDQEFSFVNMSDEYENKNPEHVDIKLTRNISSEIELELPDCPNADDFQITDFNRPNSIISFDNKHIERKPTISEHESSILELDFKPDSSLSVNNESEYSETLKLEKSEVNTTKADVENTLLELIHSSNKEDVDDKILSTSDENIEIVSQSDKVKDDSLYKEVIEVDNANKLKINEDVNAEPAAENKQDIIDKLVENAQMNVSEGKTELLNEHISNSGSSNELIDVSANKNETKILQDNINDSKEENADSECSKLNDAHCDDITDVQSSAKHSIAFENTNKSDLTHLIKKPEYQYGDNCNQYQPIQNSIRFPPFNNQYCNNNASGFNNYTPYRPGVIPDTRHLYRHPTVQPVNVIPPNIPYVNHGQFYQNTGNYRQVPPYPLINQTPIQNQSSDHIIRELAKGGNIYSNINDFNAANQANSQDTNTTINLKLLHDMGFRDEEKNLRLLKKFGNNLQDTVHELID